MKIYTLCLIFFCNALFAAHIENLVSINLKIEDVNFKTQMKSVVFNGESIELDPSELFKPRKAVNYRLPPGRYIVQWSTEKVGVKLANDPPPMLNEKIIAIESGDKDVRISIKGNSITLY